MNDIQAVITQENAKIFCNFDQVEKAITNKLKEYKDAVFTEDSKVYAKKEIASLRAEKKSFQDNMKDAKKQYMVPWDEFEVQAKKLIGLYDEPINSISEQVQAFEKKRIQEKKKLISEIYGSITEEVQEYISLERIYNAKWENATYKEKNIKKDISELTERILSDIKTIQEINSEAVPKALEKYKDSLILADAVAYIGSYERQKQEILVKEQERKRREEEERIRREERERMQREQKAQKSLETALRQAEEERKLAVEQAKVEATQELIDSFIPDMETETELYEYRIALSDEAKEKLEIYMDSIGIEWELI